LTCSGSLTPEANSLHEILEAGIGPDAIESWVDIKVDQQIRSFSIALFEPLKASPLSGDHYYFP